MAAGEKGWLTICKEEIQWFSWLCCSLIRNLCFCSCDVRWQTTKFQHASINSVPMWKRQNLFGHGEYTKLWRNMANISMMSGKFLTLFFFFSDSLFFFSHSLWLIAVAMCLFLSSVFFFFCIPINVAYQIRKPLALWKISRSTAFEFFLSLSVLQLQPRRPDLCKLYWGSNCWGMECFALNV